MKKLFWLLPIILIGVLLTFCKKDFVIELNNNSKSEYFPNSVGSYWKYSRFDSISGITDTVIVKIRSTIVKNGRTYSVKTFEKSGKVYDTVYVNTSKDSVEILSSNFQLAKQVILIPYTVNSKWNSSGLFGDSTIVSDEEKVNTIETFRIYHRIFGIDISLNDNMWLAPNVGIIKENIKVFNMFKQRNESWILLDYSIYKNW